MPKILFITQHWPHKATYGSELRSFHIRRALQEMGQVSVIVLDVEGGAEGWSDKCDNGFSLVDSIKVNEYANRNIYQKLRWALNSRSAHPQGKCIDSEAAERIVSQIENYDLIWFNKIRTASMFPQWAWPRSVLDIDDVPSAFETSVLKDGGSFSQMLMTSLRRHSWRRRERLLEERFTTLAVCSEDDKRYLQSMGVNVPTHVIPNGFEQPLTETLRSPATPPRIGFVGLFDYYPNVEGIQWFVRHCWPRIKGIRPDVQLRLVGRSSDGPLKPSGPDIEGLGRVEDLDDEVATWSLMVVPIHKGSGTRGKIAFAFSRGCPVVSTSLGTYGYEVQDEQEILLADSPDDFADACLRVFQLPHEAAKMAERAKKKFLENWTWEAIKPRIWATAEDCLRRSANSLTQVTSDD